MLISSKRSGFTLVELLIVIVVIAILAAITIVSYNGIQTRAKNVAMISGASTLIKALKAYKITNGAYPEPTDLGTTYSCLGTTSQLTAKDGFSAGECANGVTGISTVVNDALLSQISAIPDTSGYIAGGSRSVEYAYLTPGDQAIMLFYLSGNQSSCGDSSMTALYIASTDATQCLGVLK